MIPVKIISKVDIPAIKEDVIAALIKEEILRSNPELTVDSVNFERKLNPQRIEANVEAHLTSSNEPVEVATEEKIEEVEPEEEEEPKVEEEPKPKRKKVFA